MGKITCPHCNTATALGPVFIKDERAFMPNRSNDRERIYEKAVTLAVLDAEHPFDVSFGIFECEACNERFVAKKHKYDDIDWVVVYPLPHKFVNEAIPEKVRNQFIEAQACFSVGANSGCLLMCRTTLISVQRDKNVNNLKELSEKEIISGMLYRQADEVRLWANMVGHEDVPEKVNKDDCEQLLAYIEALLHAIYIEPKRLSDLAKKREQLK